MGLSLALGRWTSLQPPAHLRSPRSQTDRPHLHGPRSALLARRPSPWLSAGRWKARTCLERARAESRRGSGLKESLL
ncbi:hypothetical protein C8Q70DRAFT_938491 [Cubamyces menziesii]|nr:hypothetical protein C8Q70DRAFT_938491 [Cubamyces menziesii]